MAKLGYTFYPKDWNNDDEVFELELSERGLFRELIDMAMMNDNKTVVKLSIWSRKLNTSETDLNAILLKLSDLKLIKITDGKLFIQSCEKRLKLVRGGKKGGYKSKPTTKPLRKPIVKPTPKPTPKQIETKRERETKIEIEKSIKKEMPTLEVFLAYCQTEIPNKYTELKFSLEAKYKSWFENNWKDGNNKTIKNWKTKIKNTIPYLKSFQPKGGNTIHQRPRISV